MMLEAVTESDGSAPRSDECEERLAKILDEYLLAAERGEPVSPDELLRQHPDDAPQLRSYLSGLRLFHNAAARVSGVTDAAGPAVLAAPVGALDDFELLGEIGRGGMGVVYEARQRSLRRRVALKILAHAAGQDEKQIRRFQHEAQSAANIDHPNIVPVYAVGESAGVHYYVMQLIEGRSLAAVLSALRGADANAPASGALTLDLCAADTRRDEADATAPVSRPAPIAPAAAGSNRHGESRRLREVARLGAQAAHALHAAHEYGIVHRDVKPSNLLVDNAGKLWVTDFGLARSRDSGGVTQTGDILGTMRYMSPEQALGRAEAIDHRTDVYSLGVTLYELASLHHPNGEASDLQLLLDRGCLSVKPLRHWNRQAPTDLQTIIMKAMAEAPAERYATAGAFAEDLDRFLAGRPIQATPPTLFSRAGKWARRHSTAVLGTVALLAAALIVQTYYSVQLTRQAAQLAQKDAERTAALAASQKNLHSALEVLDRFGTRTVDQLAAIPGGEGVRYALLQDSLAFYEELAAKATGVPALADDLAKAYGKLGSLSAKLGDAQQAIARHTAAREAWRARLKNSPASPQYSHRLARSHNQVGLLLLADGRPAEALPEFQSAERVLRDLPGESAAAFETQAELATTLSNQGLAENALGSASQAAARFSAAIALQQELRRHAPDSEQVLRGLAASYNNLGSLTGYASQATILDAHQHAIDIQRSLVTTHPVNRLYQGELARTFSNLGYLLTRQEDWDAAVASYGNAIKLQLHLVDSSPWAVSYRRDLAISYNNLGMAQSHGNNVGAAEASFRRAAKLQELVLAASPDDPATLSRLGCVHNNLGLLFSRQRKHAEAEREFSLAVRRQRLACTSAPLVPTYRAYLRNHSTNYAQCLLAQHKTEEADAVLNRSVAALQTLSDATN